MRVADPEDPAATLGAARLVPVAARQRLREILTSGRRMQGPPSENPGSAPPPDACPACGAVFPREERQGSGWQWTRFAAHLVAAHDAWWPDLDSVAGVRRGESSLLEDDLGDDDEAVAETMLLLESAAEPAESARVAPAARRERSAPPRPRPSSLPPPPPRGPETSLLATSRGPATPPWGEGRIGRGGPVRRDRGVGMPRDPGVRFGETEAAAAEAISRAYAQSPALSAAIVRSALAVGAHPYDMANLINFESGGTFSPRVAGPGGSAVGLIQFIPSTARWLGTSTEELASLSAVEQMPWVTTYLQKMRARVRGSPLDTPQKLAMAVFYPDAMGWPADTQFPKWVTDSNTHVVAGKRFPIRTPADYITLMRGKSRLPFSDELPSETRSVVPEESSIFDQLLSAARGIFWPSSPAEDGGTTADTAGTWDLSPGASGVLVDAAGREWGPGLVPPGDYVFRSATGKESPPLRVESGRRYRASAIGRVFPVG